MAADLAEMWLLSFNNLGVKLLLCAINVYTKCAWIKPLKLKQFFMVLLKQWMNLNLNQINYRLIKKKDFSIALCKNG